MQSPKNPGAQVHQRRVDSRSIRGVLNMSAHNARPGQYGVCLQAELLLPMYYFLAKTKCGVPALQHGGAWIASAVPWTDRMERGTGLYQKTVSE
jgi:hypothetical protein